MELSRRSLLFAPLGLAVPTEDTVLVRALKGLGWDSADRLPLLVILPEQAPRFLNLPEKPSLAELAGAFQRQITRLPTLTVLTPTMMDVLEVPKTPPDALVARQRGHVLTRLLSTLSDAQWGRIVSPQGLGAGDLSPEQQPLLQAITGRISECWRSNAKEPFANHELLSERERSAIRLQVTRMLQLGVPVSSADEPDADVNYLFGPEQYLPSQDRLHVDESREPVYLLTRVPTKRKASHLNYDLPVLNKTVSLAGVATLGELLQRVAQGTRLELYTDPRVAKLPVWSAANGRIVRSGEVLQALALSVTGTFRKVGPAYVLTDDLVGIGTRIALWDVWWKSAEALRDKATSEDCTKLYGRGKGLRWSPGSDLGLSPAQLQRVLSGEDMSLEPSVFSSGILARVEAGVKDEKTSLKPGAPFDLIPALNLSVILPGRGTAVLETLDSMGTNDKLDDVLRPDAEPEDTAPPAPDPGPVSWQKSIQERVLLASVKSVVEATALAALAKRFGFTQLALSAEPEALKAALATKAVPIAALIAPFSSTEPELANLSLLGEPSRAAVARLAKTPIATRDDFSQTVAQLQTEAGDWARIDSAERRATLLQSLLARARVPGLTQVLLYDTEIPGYADNLWGTPTLAGIFGWTPAHRLIFLRAQGRDPLDLTPESPSNYGLDSLPLAFFPHSEALSEAWKSLLQEESSQFLSQLKSAYQKAGLAPSLVLRQDVLVVESFRDLWGIAEGTADTKVIVDARTYSLPSLKALLEKALKPG